MTIFGNLAGGDQIDTALLDVLDTWMPTYLRAVATNRGISALAAPKSIVAVSEFARFPEQQLPAVVIVNPGPPSTRERSGAYDASWPVEVAVEVIAGTQRDARRNAQLYLVAARECLLRRRSQGAGFRSTDWGGESYTLVDVEDRRSRAGASASFLIDREAVAQIGGGPGEPDAEPYPDLPKVETVEITVEKTD